MAPNPDSHPRRHSHRHSDSRGQLLPRTRTNEPTIRAVPASRRPSARHAHATSYAERHRAAFSSGSGSISVSASPARKTSTRAREASSDDRVAKRRRHKRRATLDHNHYRDSTSSGSLWGEKKVETQRRRRSSRGKEEGSWRDQEGQRAGSARRRRRKWLIIAIVIVVLIAVLIIAVAVGVTVGKRGSDGAGEARPLNASLSGIAPSSVPLNARGTYFDPFTWYDTTDFNLTYTNDTVGGLPIMGLNSTWNDNVQPNTRVPKLAEPFEYGQAVIKGMNIGGWFSLEPFITPVFFDASKGIVDEWTLTKSLGAQQAAATLEKHYATFANRESFRAIAAAGFDHVRIPYSYWAVTTYTGDPYVPRISFRYLLRAIEYARQYGLRVNLDLHGAPGSQNGWPHSGRQGMINWLNGPDGQVNGDRTLDVHRQLTAFFSQPRYHNVVTMYGIVNEPRMVVLDRDVVLNWTAAAIAILRGSGMPHRTVAVIGDGFLGLANWKGSQLLSLPNTTTQNLLLDAHQYAIFALDQLSLSHADKLEYVCDGFAQQTAASMNVSTGFGNFLCGEWSQADTDCATNLNDAGVGSRWDGTLDTGNRVTSVLEPTCPAHNSSCSCAPANATPSNYSAAYKRWLQSFAAAQRASFERGWGSFYWTWETANATQWSWRRGIEAGIVPAHVDDLQSTCGQGVDWSGIGLPETY